MTKQLVVSNVSIFQTSQIYPPTRTLIGSVSARLPVKHWGKVGLPYIIIYGRTG